MPSMLFLFLLEKCFIHLIVFPYCIAFGGRRSAVDGYSTYLHQKDNASGSNKPSL